MLALRPLTDADVDALAAMHVRTWQAGYAGIMPAEVLDGLEPAAFAESRRRRGPAGAQTLVAEDGGTIVGFVEIYAIYVATEGWGTGAGHALMDGAREALAAAGNTEVRLWVLEANE